MGAFKPDRDGIAAMINNQELMGPPLLELAEKVKAEAEATAPYYAKSKNPQHFKNSFRVGLVEDVYTRWKRAVSEKRVAATVYSTDPDGLHIETGTSTKPAHNTLSFALDVLGGE